ncbi:hypothetical protein D9756_000941 [Leucocoprinus leucothites]|uniref:SH3 domain-containing protein n=1 Tax=Leucocoprinus leucothites TaxID=201217 RepID=A0A8H5GG54_9AGAR|nr:hypothetical protein D9756_000941 [Leucoagaricus leucothites]
MVFTNLGANEKDAFFSLLDEYFQSRPEVLNATKGGFDASSTSTTTTGNSNPFRKEITNAQAHAAAAAVGRAGDAASKFVSAGFKSMQNANANANANNSRATPAHASAPSVSAGQHRDDGDSNNHDNQHGGSLADRIAALQGGGKRDATGFSNTAERGSVSGLASVKKFGDVDVTSGKNFFGSIRNSSSNPPKSSFQHTPSSAADNIPSAFPPRNSASKFGPPPTRAAAAPPPPPPRQPEPEPEDEQGPGEWAESLYDFDSPEAGDLDLKEGQRVLVIERTSDDWWTVDFRSFTIAVRVS